MLGKKFMMLSFTVALTFGINGLAFGGTTTDEGPGCGLGKVAWAGSGADEKAIGPQLLMSTTNNTILPWQAFGITTGTLGCNNNGKLWAERKVSMFAHVNFENLSREMAQGHGEHLSSMATLMGIPDEHHAQFFSMTQQKYATLIEQGETSPKAMVKALNDSIETSPVLAQLSISR